MSCLPEAGNTSLWFGNEVLGGVGTSGTVAFPRRDMPLSPSTGCSEVDGERWLQSRQPHKNSPSLLPQVLLHWLGDWCVAQTGSNTVMPVALADGSTADI